VADSDIAVIYKDGIYYLIDAQTERLSLWLARERDRAFDDEIVTLVHRFRAAQVDAMIIVLDELRCLALKRSEAHAGLEAS
jgi:hypothetical protein